MSSEENLAACFEALRELNDLGESIAEMFAGSSSSSAGVPASGDKNMETLAEIFRCFICMEKLRDARMCPRCSKLCCNGCIRRWLLETRPQCPHCRASLHLHELVNCRWAEEVTQQLDMLEQSQSSRKNGGSSSALALIETDMDSERCSTHSREELSVYCDTCKCCICHECALWCSSHASHVFFPLDEVYARHCQQIKEQVTRLRRKFMEMLGTVQDMEKNIDSIRTAKDQKVKEIRNAVELMIARLDSQLKSKLMTLVSQKGAVTRKSEEIEGLLREIEVKLNSGGKSELIKHSSRLMKMIQDSINQSTFTMPPVLADFQSELVPSYESVTYTVHKFSQLRLKADPFYTDPLKMNGLSWRLKIYPDGNGVVRGTFLSVFLELTSGPPEQAKYEYRIEMIYQLANDPSKNMSREFASDFEISECWGYNRFFRIDLLETDGFLDPVHDTIKLRFDVRNPTYNQKCKDQQWYINQLLNTNSQQAMKIAELSSRIRCLENELQAPMDDTMNSTTGGSVVVEESDGECTAVRNISPNCSRELLNLDESLVDLEPLDDSDDNASEHESEGSEAEQDSKSVRDSECADENDVDNENAEGDPDSSDTIDLEREISSLFRNASELEPSQ